MEGGRLVNGRRPSVMASLTEVRAAPRTLGFCLQGKFFKINRRKRKINESGQPTKITNTNINFVFFSQLTIKPINTLLSVEWEVHMKMW